MAREPNQTEARGMWDVTRPNQQRNAIYGERWPTPYIPYTFEKCAFSRSNYGGSISGVYTGLANGNGTNIGTGYPVLYNGWGYGQTSMDWVSFQVWDSNGWPSDPYTLDWIMISRPYNASFWTDYVVRISTGTDFSSNVVYETGGSIYLNTSSSVATYQRLDLPNTGTLQGTTNLTMNTDYNIGLKYTSGWWTYSGNSAYMASGVHTTQQTHTLTNGRTVGMSWFDQVSNANWNGYSNNGTGSSYGQLYLYGLSV